MPEANIFWLEVLIAFLAAEIVLKLFGVFYERICTKKGRGISPIWEFEKLLLDFLLAVMLAVAVATYNDAPYSLINMITLGGILLCHIISGILVYIRHKRRRQSASSS